MERFVCVLLWIWMSWNIFMGVPFLTEAEVTMEVPLGAEGNELVLDKGQEFTLTCTGDVPISWNYSSYTLPEDETGSQKTSRKDLVHGQYRSTLTVTNAYYLDTGYFTCFPSDENQNSSWAQSIYVYVRDPENPLATENSFQVIVLTTDLGETVVLPCRPTDPSLEVILMKDDEIVPAITYDPHIGFTFVADQVHQAGYYGCVVTDTDVKQDIVLTVNFKTATTDIEKPHVTVSPYPVVEGMNVTFDCSVHYDIGVTIGLNWDYPAKIYDDRVKLSNISMVDEKKGDKVIGRKGILLMTLYDVTKRDEGNFTCHVRDHSGNKQEYVYSLQVLNDSMLEMALRGQKLIKIPPGQQNVRVVVEVKAHPLPEKIQWYDYNGDPITEHDTTYSVSNTSTESVLTIHHPGVQFSGTYSLFVDNRARNKTINVTLHVLGEPELLLNGGKPEMFALEGQHQQIDCDVFAFPRPNITWHFTPCENYPSCSPRSELISPNQYSELDVSTVRGMIKSTVRLQINQTGEISCKAQNELGFKQESTTIITTDVENGFGIKYPDSVVETDNVTLTCGASKYWYKQDLQWLYTDNNGTSTPVLDALYWNEDTNSTYFVKLNIPDVTKTHKGNYSCVATLIFGRNKKNHTDYIMNVQRLQKPEIFKKVNSSWVVKTGRTVILKCDVIGAPNPIITWHKDGFKVSSSSKFELHNNGQLLKVHVGLEEDGNYVCNAVNKAGYDKLHFKIEVTDKTNKLFMFCLYMGVLLVVGIVAAVLVLLYARRTKKLKKEIQELKEAGLLNFEKGNIESLNPELDVGEQADLLPYDSKKWEFPRDKLKLGKILGSGAFGLVLKAEAYELEEEGVATTVAVKMVKRNSNVASIKALASELKIMVHLGKHLNVVNVLGACTGDLNKRELLVLVEYCQYGNLHKYLLERRGAFINQVNPSTGAFDPTHIQPLSPTSPNARFSDAFSTSEMYRFANGRASTRDSAAVSTATGTTLIHSDMSEHAQPALNSSMETPIGDDGYLVSRDHEWRNKDRGDYKEGLKSVCTQDLICWAFQIARGMEYLASRKVLHGDLAARNVLLADDNIVKICDFGFSKSIYSDCYKKSGDGPLPVKWMPLESILDKVFSTQSDVWAYGITLWELFSLARNPYPGLDDVKKLIASLQAGYRMEEPKFATQQVYKVMLDCWHDNPHSRPSFTELTERLGSMLEDTVRTHYVDLNDPFLQENSEYLAQQDYLSMLRSPTYVNWSPTHPHPGYSVMKTIDEAMELTPMLDSRGGSANRSSPDSPDSSPTITKPIGNNYVNVAQAVSFSNPSYHNLGRPKQSPYLNMPD